MCGIIDICLRKLKPKCICIVGLSRSGKSTIYNNINNIELIGDLPECSKRKKDLCYKVYLENAETEAAQARPGY